MTVADNHLPSASALVEDYFRHEYGHVVAVLAVKFGLRHLELIEDSTQNALARALDLWVVNGTPADPGAWLYRVAFNGVIEELRSRARRQRLLEAAGDPDQVEAVGPDARLNGDFADDMLRMLFVCCCDEIAPQSRLVFALKTLCGFSTAEIAHRLFLSTANVHKRLSRAREHLRDIDITNALTPEALRDRLASVQAVLYLLFNEGYLSTRSTCAIRQELCEEALRLTAMLAEHSSGATPGTFALLAMMHFHAARLSTRLDPVGGLLMMEEQDRSAWDTTHIAAGASWLKRSATGDSFTRYHAEAGIAAEHAFAPTFRETRWQEIAGLYEALDRIVPSPLNLLNRAVAVAEWQGPQRGLELLEAAGQVLSDYYLWDAVLGDLYRRLGRPTEAQRHTSLALAHAPTEAERALLEKRLAKFNV